MAVTGTVYWVTGLAGAGKSTIGRVLAERLRARDGRVVVLDGDELRAVLGDAHGHGFDDRLRLALTYARLCGMLAAQGLDVVCATVSMLHQVRAWNREHLARYREIWVRVPHAVLVRRDQKLLYSSGARNVVGMDVPVEEPRTPDLIVDNDGSRPPEAIVDEILAALASRP